MGKRGGGLMLVMVFLLGVFLARLPATIQALSGRADWERATAEVRELLERKYVEPVDSERLTRAAIEGMVESLDDRYTQFIPPSDAEAFHKEIAREFVGIGAAINTADGWLNIISPIEASPALAAGLAPGDRVEAIDSVSTQGRSADECIKLLKGEPGTDVKLQISRITAPQGDGAEPQRTRLEITVKRAEITSPAVRGLRFLPERQQWDHVLDPAAGIGYIRLEQFTPSAGEEVVKAIEQLKSQLPGGVKGLVLDLRDNGGGSLDVAVEIADGFLDAGAIVSTRGRPGSNARSMGFTAEQGQWLPGVPLVVLVNGASASASEILAGALAEQSPPRALVVGTRTFGKGLVQVVEPLFSLPGGMLKLTEQRYYLPSGRMIQRTDASDVWGIDPSPGFRVSLEEGRELPLLLKRRWLEGVRRADVPSPPPPAGLGEAKFADPAWVREDLGDAQLALAVEAAQTRIATGAFPSRPDGSATADAQTTLSAERSMRERVHRRLLTDLRQVERRLETAESATAGTPTGSPPHGRKPLSLWDDTLDLRGGTLEVRGADGRPVTRLRITGPELESLLLEADIEPADEPADGQTGQQTTPKPEGNK